MHKLWRHLDKCERVKYVVLSRATFLHQVARVRSPDICEYEYTIDVKNKLLGNRNINLNRQGFRLEHFITDALEEGKAMKSTSIPIWLFLGYCGQDSRLMEQGLYTNHTHDIHDVFYKGELILTLDISDKEKPMLSYRLKGSILRGD